MELSDRDFWQVLQVQPPGGRGEEPAVGRAWIEWAKAEVLSVGLSAINNSLQQQKGCFYLARLLQVLDVLAKQGIVSPLCRQYDDSLLYRDDYVGALLANGLEACGCDCHDTAYVLLVAARDKFLFEHEVDEWRPGMASGSGMRTYLELNFKGRRRAEAASEMPAFFDETPEESNCTETLSQYFYLFAGLDRAPDQSPAYVFYKVKGQERAQTLRRILAKENSPQNTLVFHLAPAATITMDDKVLFDDALNMLESYDDPDPGVYDPPLTKEIVLRAQLAFRARKLEDLLREKGDETPQDKDLPSNDDAEAGQVLEGNLTTDPDERRNACLIVLMLLAQAYYKLLEAAKSSWVYSLDLELNSSYLWVTQNITNLLANNEDMQDFPVKFEPLFPDLFPNTIVDFDWEDMVAPSAESFLSTVQRYVLEKQTYEPEEKSTGWMLVESMRPGVITAIERSDEYRKRMLKKQRRILAASKEGGKPVDENSETQTSGKTGDTQEGVGVKLPATSPNGSTQKPDLNRRVAVGENVRAFSPVDKERLDAEELHEREHGEMAAENFTGNGSRVSPLQDESPGEKKEGSCESVETGEIPDYYEHEDGMRFFDFNKVYELYLPTSPWKTDTRELWIGGRPDLGCKDRRYRIFKIFDCSAPNETNKWPTVDIWNATTNCDEECYLLAWNLLVFDSRDVFRLIVKLTFESRNEALKVKDACPTKVLVEPIFGHYADDGKIVVQFSEQSVVRNSVEAGCLLIEEPSQAERTRLADLQGQENHEGAVAIGKSRNPPEKWSPPKDTEYPYRAQEIRALYDKGEIPKAVSLALCAFESYPTELVKIGMTSSQDQKPIATPQSFRASGQLVRLMNLAASFLTCLGETIGLDYNFDIGFQALIDVYNPDPSGKSRYGVKYPRPGSIYRNLWPDCLDPEALERLPMALRNDLIRLRDEADKLRRKIRNRKLLQSAIGREFDAARAFFPLDEERLDAEELHEREHGSFVVDMEANDGDHGDKASVEQGGREQGVASIEADCREGLGIGSTGFESFGKTLGSVHAIVEQSHLELRKLTETSETTLKHVRGVQYLEQDLDEARGEHEALALEIQSRIADILTPEQQRIWIAVRTAGTYKGAIPLLREYGVKMSEPTLGRRVKEIDAILKKNELSPCKASGPIKRFSKSPAFIDQGGEIVSEDLSAVEEDWAADPPSRDTTIRAYLAARPEDKAYFEQTKPGIADEAAKYSKRRPMKSN